jgi:hypothetical protein
MPRSVLTSVLASFFLSHFSFLTFMLASFGFLCQFTILHGSLGRGLNLECHSNRNRFPELVISFE